MNGETEKIILLDTRTITLTRDGRRHSRHQIETLTYHVRGWVRTRCLTHGIEGIQTSRGGDIAGAKDCYRQRDLWRFRAQLQPWRADK